MSIQKMLVRQNEYMLGTREGLKFVVYDPNEKEFSSVYQDIEQKTPLCFLAGRQTLQAKEVERDLILTADYNVAGYFLINRGTREIRHITDRMTDNRGCFDIAVLPHFDLDAYPFAICKGRKGISIVNLKTYMAEQFILSEEM